MTFFPEPLRPSEGRQKDEPRVDPIEADKKRKGNLDWGEDEKEKEPATYGAFLGFLKKLTGFLGREKGASPEVISEDPLTNDVRNLKNLFQILMDSNQSDSGKFCGELSKAWHQLLQGVQVLERTRRRAFVNPEKLKTLLGEIDNYPPNEEHKLGFYLSKYAGEEWLPLPFRQILKHLFTDHRLNGENSVLSKWVDGFTQLLQS